MDETKIQYLQYMDDGSELTGHSILNHYPLNSVVKANHLPHGKLYRIVGIKSEFLTEEEDAHTNGISFPRKLSYSIKHSAGATIYNVAPNQITLVEESKVNHWPLGAMTIEKDLGEYAESQELIEVTCNPERRDEDVEVRYVAYNVQFDQPEFQHFSADQIALAGKYPNSCG